ncbi:amino acid adenylation domain-containing protein [Sporomusaceae bacterium BoRhaA]|uniref:non-ribosomal peptide synthetase n=1 Tax=Pelorhabdus rhamnosifermentans TaxID=2772457 RepID=UPI001C0641D9|nr:non-ribosomal peptide synthetase [Pelorhabdus rhamnosifermentans]MBU2699290.1 amino acid adenylation domain-containing protein [Pelorhabdus rhamnosifermentans]
MEYQSLVEAIQAKKNLNNRGVIFVESGNNETFISYEELYSKALIILAELQKRGLKPGSELVFQIADNEQFICTFWGCLLGKIIPVPIAVGNNDENRLKLFKIWEILKNPYLIIDEKTMIMLENFAQKNCLNTMITRNKAIVFEEFELTTIEGVIYPPHLSDIAFIQFSSGSTGNPKGVILTHENILTNVNDIIERGRINSEDSSLSWMPLTHDMGLICVHLTNLVAGINQYIMPTTLFIRNPYLWMQKTHEHRVSLLYSPNFGFRYFLDSIHPESDTEWDLSIVKFIWNGAEPISIELCNEFLNKMRKYGLKKTTITPCYGLAEASVGAASAFVEEEMDSVYLDRKYLNIEQMVKEKRDKLGGIRFAYLGHPLNSCRIRICNCENKVLEDNIVGYIQIQGKNVTSGYYNNIEATEKVITNDGWLNTGDVGFARNGGLFVIGRAKDIIFVNGQNYYPHDVERIVEEIEGLKLGRVAVCGVFSEETQTENIICFVLYKKGLEEFPVLANRLKNYVGKQMGLEIKEVIPLKRMPKTTSGKVQRYKLKEKYEKGDFLEISQAIKKLIVEQEKNEYVAPRNEIEKKMAKVWEEVLEIDRVGIEDGFSALGGNSLRAITLLSRMSEEFGIEIPLKEIFKAQTIKELVRYMKDAKKVSYPVYPEKIPDWKNLHMPFPLTEIQAAYLLGRGDYFELGGVASHWYIEIETSLDLERFNRSLQKVVKRHPMLRAIVLPNGKQKILEKVPDYKIRIEDLNSVDADAQQLRILKERERMSHYVFKTDQWPLFEFKAFKLSNEISYLFIGFDLIIADAASMKIINKELMDFYMNPERELPEIEFSFRDYILAYEEFKHSTVYAEDKKYWLSKLNDFPSAPNLPLKCDPQEITKPHFKRHQYLFSEKEWDSIKLCAQELNITPAALLCTAYAEVMAFWSNQPRLVINSTIFHRNPFHKDINNIVGEFTPTMLLDINFEEKSFREKAKDVHNTLMEALEHRHYDGISLIREIAKQNNLGNTKTIMPVVFTSMLFDIKDLERIGEIKMAISQTPQVFIDNQIAENNGNLLVTWDYVEELFDKDDINAMFKQYIDRISSLIVQRKEQVLKVKEQDQLLINQYNQTTEQIFPTTLHQLFIEQAQRTPDKPAVMLGEESITYQELHERSNQVARYLKEKGVSRNDYIGVMVYRRIETIFNILGILKAGAAYVPIEPEYPAERQQYILKNSSCRMLLIPEDYDDKNMGQYSVEPIGVASDPEDIAYAIYTSGSTGRPKGVVITHKAATNTIIDINQKFSVNDDDRIIGLSSMCFDLSVYDIFGALSAGALLVMVPDQKDVMNLIAVMKKQKITIWNSVPAIMDMLVENLDDNSEKDEQTFYWSPFQDKVIKYKKNENLRLVLLSGDWIPLKLPEKTRDYFINAEVISLGGATEASIWSIYYPILEVHGNWKSIPYGIPLANQQFYVLNYEMNFCPIGVPGELYIGGAGVAKGYLNDEEKTKIAFINHPQLGYLYKTGDYGVMHKAGYIEFLGRKDQQVKIRGYRIELGEIENRLLEHELVNNVVVVSFIDENKQKYLCAYIVADQKLSIAGLREYIAKVLPNYMIPSCFVQLKEIPLTANGKIDKKSLPQPEGNIGVGAAYVAPQDETEEKMAELWKEILGVEKVGIEDDFFELGGHSLKAITLVAKINQKFGIEVPLQEIFKSSTIKKLVRYMDGGAKRAKYEAIEPIAKQDYYPLSSAQKRMCILNQLDSDSIAYNFPVAFKVEGYLDKKRFEETLRKIIKRHETLRTSFELIGGEPVQRIHDNIDFKIDYIQSTDQNISDIIKKFIRPFDLSIAPLLRVSLVELSKNRCLILFDLHHIIGDGVSEGILIKELVSLYQGKDLPKLRIQYKDFAFWQNQLLRTEALKKQEEYWLNTFSGEIPILNMPTDYPRPSIRSSEGDRLHFELGEELTSKLNKLAKETSTTLYMVLLAAYNVLLAKYTGQEDIIVGSPIAGRPHVDLNNILGMFVNSLAIRSYPKGSITFLAFLKNVRENALKAYENQDYQFEKLVDRLDIVRDLSRNPLFDTMFVLQNTEIVKMALDDLKISRYQLDNKIAKFDLTLEAKERDDCLEFTMEYCTRLFKQETLERLAAHFVNLLEQIVNQPQSKLAEFEVLSKAEKRQLLIAFNDTKVDYTKDKTIQELFEEQVEKVPENIVVAFEEQQLTYRELNEKANQLARILREKEVKADDIIGIMVERSPEMIIGIMGILKAGGAYLPIDPEYPLERITYMLNDSGAGILLTQKSLTSKVPFKGETIILDDPGVYQGDHSNLTKENTPQNLAYIIYTSGSTGKPKGVEIEHSSLANLIYWYRRVYNITDVDRTTQVAGQSFDASVFEIFPYISSGAGIYIPNNEIRASASSLIPWLRDNRITISYQPTSMAEALLDADWPMDISLRALLTAGDTLHRRPCHGLPFVFVNHYGPTENTVAATWANVYDKPNNILPPIGRPIDNNQIYIVDKNNKLQPIGVPGELCISGASLARGYLNQPKLTMEKFVINPFISGERMYRTGDLAKWLPDGNIEFLGRIDRQVKIRGFRIELGEIESQLLKHPLVKETVVIARKDIEGYKDLCAYIVAEQILSVTELRKYLSNTLPDYMIPSFFIKVEKMPLTPNGKIDQKALPDPKKNICTGKKYIAPRSQTEEKVILIFEKVLGVKSIGIDDNFFELGGNSLKVISTIYKINKEFNLDLPILTLFNNPTVRNLADYIAEINSLSNNNYENLVLLKEGTKRDKNIFFIHDGSGDIGSYIQLCSVLKTDFNFWGIKFDRQTNYIPRNMTIENIAQNYLGIIRSIQPNGPYHIVGYSNGAVITYEICRLLEKLNEKVALLMLIDSNMPSLVSQRKALKTEGKLYTLDSEKQFIHEWIPDIRNIKVVDKASSIEELWMNVVTYFEKETGHVVKEMIPEDVRRLIANYHDIDNVGDLIYSVNVIRTIDRAAHNYTPANKLKTKIHLVKAAKNNFVDIKSWDRYSTKTTALYNVDGDHFTIMEQPYVIELAKIITQLIEVIALKCVN